MGCKSSKPPRGDEGASTKPIKPSEQSNAAAAMEDDDDAMSPRGRLVLLKNKQMKHGGAR